MSIVFQHYRSIIEFLELPSEKREVDSLLKWWNLRVFPSHHTESETSKTAVPSVRDKLRDWRASQARLPLNDLEFSQQDNAPSA
ncbi:hypothetical protein FA13DRAFT_1796254 [Coprinellus micaceus]|uniref:Uncharacterized protein n=1 Tax=Coprinellus micaceus TaxID=71717 RepID=A0A4Y7SV67_COPMI|nr:hypothetical protein FA13DRAFT_1796254 [Coprinellus micaceus]